MTVELRQGDALLLLDELEDETLDEVAALNAYLEAQGIDAQMAERMRERTGRYLQEVGS